MKKHKTSVDEMVEEQERYRELVHLRWSHIAMLEPFYLPNGRNGCRVHYDDNSYDEVRCKCDTVLEHLAHKYFTTIQKARAYTMECAISTQSRKQCMVFSKDCCIIPLKCREVENRNSGSLGYLVYQKLKFLVELPNGHALLLFNEQHKGIEVLQKKNSVYQKVMQARQLMLYADYERLKTMTTEPPEEGGPVGMHW